VPRVLVIEDDTDILSSLVEVIRDEGFDVSSAANGYQALAQLADDPPDLIFLDLMMPVMDGWKFLESMHARFPALEVPVVLLSAVHNLPEEARRLGVSRFLRKPFDLEDVARVAHELADAEPRGAGPTAHPRQNA
jgi:two-component system nitrogen regulation response regulator NtrX